MNIFDSIDNLVRSLIRQLGDCSKIERNEKNADNTFEKKWKKKNLVRCVDTIENTEGKLRPKALTLNGLFSNIKEECNNNCKYGIHMLCIKFWQSKKNTILLT